MTLTPDVPFGPYRIVALLGAGGMGEVYRARDERLGRDVALKVLPAALWLDPAARSRLIQEARTTATLSHPNICTLFEAGEEQGRVYLAIELVTGESLSDRIARGPLALENVIRYGIQICDALAHAHERHVIHRDLKSGNVWIAPDGRVKLLDFGIAQFAEAREPGMTDLSSALTQTGVVVGTPHFLAPELLKGAKADTRSDLWALGVVLYEMASGALPFRGATGYTLSASILHEAPAPLPARVPASLQRVIFRCLSKVPGERYQQASEVRAALQAIEPLPTDHAPPHPRARGRGVWTIAAAAVAVVVTGLALRPHQSLELNPDMRMRALDVPMSDIGYPGLSADGAWIALPTRDETGISRIHLLNARGGPARAVVVDSAAGLDYADISPDGSRIVYATFPNSVDSGIKVVDVLGGDVHEVAHPGVNPRWSPDGRRIGYIVPSFQSPIHRLEFWTVEVKGLDAKRVFVDSTSESRVPYSFAWAPDGKRIAWLKSYEHASYNEIVIHDLATGRERQLTHDRSLIDEVCWTRQDAILFSSSRRGASNVWILPARGGTPVQITRGAGPDRGLRVSADGRTLLYTVIQPLARIGWWDTVTGDTGLVAQGGESFGPPIPSPDGRRVLLQVLEPDALSPAQALIVMNRDGSGRRTLVPADQDPRGFNWSPDGRRIVWASARPSPPDSMEMRVLDLATDGATPPIVVPTGGAVQGFYWPTPDTLLVYDHVGTFRYVLSQRRVVGRLAGHEFEYPCAAPGWMVIFRRPDADKPPGIYARRLSDGTERRLIPLSWLCANPTARDYFYCWPESLGFSRMDVPSGRLRPVPHRPRGFRRGMLYYPTYDGRVVYWFDYKESSRLMLVENLYR